MLAVPAVSAASNRRPVQCEQATVHRQHGIVVHETICLR